MENVKEKFKIKSRITYFILMITLISFLASCENKQESENKIEQKVEANDGNNSVQKSSLASDLSNVSSSVFENVIGTATTSLLDKEKNRIHNIDKSIEKINGIILKSGQVFSFNDETGRRNAEKGYRKATILKGKRRSKAHGGGVCQVSTTLFQAATNAGLEILEQHQHQKKINYAEKGKDATVTYNIFDLKFKNNREKSIKIAVSNNENKTITVNIFEEK